MINRESVIACACLLATLAIAWLLDHPRKVTGTVVLLVAFAHLRGPNRSTGPRRPMRRDKGSGSNE